MGEQKEGQKDCLVGRDDLLTSVIEHESFWV